MREKRNLKKKIGIFGGTFDPPHRGHIQIANISLKKIDLDYLIWSVTKKNPLKKKPMLSLKTRIFLSKKMTNSAKKIKINVRIIVQTQHYLGLHAKRFGIGFQQRHQRLNVLALL